MCRLWARVIGCCLAAVACVFLANCDGGGSDGGGGDVDVGSNDVNVVVCLGDSITEGRCVPAGLPYPSRLEVLSGKNAINQGICGEKSAGGADRVGGVLNRYSPGFLVILYGANDAIFDHSVGSVIGDIRSMIQAAKGNQTVPLVCTLLPMYDGHAFAAGNARAYSEAIRGLAKEEGARLVDLEREFGDDRSLIQADGLHPSDSGNQLIALAVNDAL
jgi:lysophospholipase L1-like esterase